MTAKTRQGISWVEILAAVLACIGVILFLLQDVIGDFPLPPAHSWVDLRSAILQIYAIVGAILCVTSGLSLFLVRPLVRLGPRAPFWLMPMVGIAILVSRDSVCRALNPGDIRSLSNSMPECQLLAPVLGLDLIFFGVVLTVRQFQVFRKRAG